MSATILSIGDELVLGQTLDTNSAWLSRELAALGVSVRAHVTVSDDQPAIERALREAAAVSDLLLVTGGLGPTRDDLTRQALAAVMGVELSLDEACLRELQAFFAARGRPMPQSNRIQAMMPAGARVLLNRAGTAPGIGATLARQGGACRVFVMPGVPKEMEIMFAERVRPDLAEGSAGVILSRTLHTFGLGESSIGEMLGELMDRRRNPSVGTTVSGGVVSLRLAARYADRAEALRQLDATADACRAAVGDLCYGQDQQTLAAAVVDLLRQAGKTVATAESCTGGLVAKLLTDVAGSSAAFGYGWVTYANAAKQRLLDVSEALLAEHGAVSLPVVREMARSARRRGSADYAIAISGVAGPDGGTDDKPVGTVCIALATPAGMQARRFLFAGEREMIRDRSAKMALMLLRLALLGAPVPF